MTEKFISFYNCPPNPSYLWFVQSDNFDEGCRILKETWNVTWDPSKMNNENHLSLKDAINFRTRNLKDLKREMIKVGSHTKYSYVIWYRPKSCEVCR